MKKTILMLTIVGFAYSQTGFEIAKMMDEKPTPEDMSNKTNMVLTNSKGKSRTNTMASKSMDSNKKQIIWFLEPKDDKGVAFLKIEHDDKDDEMRMWLPAFKKVRRISAKKRSDHSKAALPSAPPSEAEGTTELVTVNTPAELSAIFSAATSEAPVMKLNLVALLEALKLPSDTAAILAATRIASVPVASSGAWKFICPITSAAAKSVSPVWRDKRTGWSSPVATLFMKRPSSGS